MCRSGNPATMLLIINNETELYLSSDRDSTLMPMSVVNYRTSCPDASPFLSSDRSQSLQHKFTSLTRLRVHIELLHLRFRCC